PRSQCTACLSCATPVVARSLAIPGPPDRLLGCVTTRPPPRSPLFPYTTLFRSLAEARRLAGLTRLGRLAVRGLLGLAVAGLGALDRKSTRLNSSHVKISYAVFCLKKKTRPLQHRRDQLERDTGRMNSRPGPTAY